MADQKQYPRNAKGSDYAITGENSNGINFSKDGNNFLYSGNDPEYLDALRKGTLSSNDGQIDINDPNNVSSFIGMFVEGQSSVNLGNPTQQSLNINNNNLPQQEIITPIIVPVSSPLPNKEPLPSPSPSPPPPTTIIETQDESADIQVIEFDDLPQEEPLQLFETIQVTDISVTTIKFEDPQVYRKYFKTQINNNEIKYNTGGTPTGNYTLNGKKIDISQCEVYYGDKVPYIAQLNNWGCLVTSISMISPAQGINITQGMFYDNTNINTRKQPYILEGNCCDFNKLQKDYPRLKRETIINKYNKKEVFEGYKSKLRSLKQPIVIRMQGCSNPSRGHYVVVIGITKDGNLIIHNPARRIIAFQDNVIGSDVLLGIGGADNGKNYDIIYIQ